MLFLGWIFLTVAIASLSFQLGRVREYRLQARKAEKRKISVSCTCPQCSIH